MLPGSRTALTLTLLVALLGGALVGYGAAGSAFQDRDFSQPQVDPEAGPSLTIVVDVQSDGDARWRVSTSFDLATETEREAFRTLAESFENGQTSALGLTAFRRASREVGATADRQMSITDVERRSSPDSVVENGTGRLTLQFTWTNFARTDGDQLRVDDVYATGPNGETWLPGLESGDTLLVRSPEGYGVTSSTVPPQSRDNRSVLEWTGPATLGADDLRVVFTGQPATQTPPDPQGSVPWLLVVAVGLGGGAVAAYLFVRGRGGSPAPVPGSTDPDPDPSPGDDEDQATTEPAPGADTGDESAGAAELDIDEELLSDEERVELLLERNGGRMKQANIVKKTGWSNAKVSQLLSAMEEEGQVDKLRIGRENLISFPEEDVTDIKE
jgi:hypothetical protein